MARCGESQWCQIRRLGFWWLEQADEIGILAWPRLAVTGLLVREPVPSEPGSGRATWRGQWRGLGKERRLVKRAPATNNKRVFGRFGLFPRSPGLFAPDSHQKNPFFAADMERSMVQWMIPT